MRQILSFLSGGLVGGFLGAFLGGLTKFFWDRWLPDRLTWKREQRLEREKLMSQYSGPAIRAFHDLERRIYGTVEEQARDYEDLKEEGHQEYYVDSTAFLIAQGYAWLEVLRDRMGILDYADLVSQLDKVSASFAGRIRGFRIFRLEQREIGERMVSMNNGEICCTGYSEFIDAIKKAEPVPCFVALHKRVETMLERWEYEIVRLIRIQHALVDVINFIDPDFRWVPEMKRIKLDPGQVVEKLCKEKLISSENAETFKEQARQYNLM